MTMLNATMPRDPDSKSALSPVARQERRRLARGVTHVVMGTALAALVGAVVAVVFS
jgi:hypothetical protein